MKPASSLAIDMHPTETLVGRSMSRLRENAARDRTDAVATNGFVQANVVGQSMTFFVTRRSRRRRARLWKK